MIKKDKAEKLLEREIRVQEAIRNAKISYELCQDPSKFEDK